MSNVQSFILGAVIHTRECLPYQHEMIDNYLVDARQRFDMEMEIKAKQKQEQMEQHEKMKREIYLNGGFVDCVNPGCVDQGTAETSYLCKSCFHEQTLVRKPQQNNTSRFYSIVPPSPTPSYNSSPAGAVRFGGKEEQQRQCFIQQQQQTVPVSTCVNKQLTSITPPSVALVTVGHIVPVAAAPAAPMRVKLPSPTPASHPCKNTSCEFYGTPELDYFCSKCSKNNVRNER